MNLAVPFAGYFLMVLIFMYGGRRRRSFGEASQVAAGTIITLLCLGAILWFLSMVLWQFAHVEN
jgi:hypothetical protein